MKPIDQLTKLERRVNLLEQEMKKRLNPFPTDLYEKRLNDVKQLSEERRKKILLKTAGILAKSDIDPVKWQKRIRKEWDARFKREIKTTFL